MNINLANQECFQKISNIGYNKIVNICSGQENIIPWGSSDWLAFGLIIIFCIFCIFAVSFLGFLAKQTISN